MSIVIKIVEPLEPVKGCYIKEFLPDTDESGRGTLFTTADKAEAKQFPNAGHAWEFWRQQSKTVPLRKDGKPNRPLTAYCVVLETI